MVVISIAKIAHGRNLIQVKDTVIILPFLITRCMC